MLQPEVIDVWNGLTTAAIRDLRRVDRLYLSMKDRRTATLGYWVEAGDTSNPGEDSEHLRVLLLHLEGPYVSNARAAVEIADLRENRPWHRFTSILRRGDGLVVERVTKGSAAGTSPGRSRSRRAAMCRRRSQALQPHLHRHRAHPARGDPRG